MCQMRAGHQCHHQPHCSCSAAAHLPTQQLVRCCCRPRLVSAVQLPVLLPVPVMVYRRCFLFTGLLFAAAVLCTMLSFRCIFPQAGAPLRLLAPMVPVTTAATTAAATATCTLSGDTEQSSAMAEARYQALSACCDMDRRFCSFASSCCCTNCTPEQWLSVLLLTA